MVHLHGTIDAGTALFFRTFFVISQRPWSPSTPPRTPRKAGRLYTGQARRISLGYCAGASFWPKGWGPSAAIHAAAVIRRAR